MKVVILAAGMGMRFNSPLPKCLTVLSNGISILETQLNNLSPYVNSDDIYVVVGYKKELIMEAVPNLLYVYNPRFATTGACKSLGIALQKIDYDDVLWLNGDVLFHHQIINKLLTKDKNCMAVNKTSILGDEEVKYTLNPDGTIQSVSKSLSSALGEVLGINLIKADSLELLKSNQKLCTDGDFAIRSVDLAIKSGLIIYPVYVEDNFCMEIDFFEDYQVVNDNLDQILTS